MKYTYIALEIIAGIIVIFILSNIFTKNSNIKQKENSQNTAKEMSDTRDQTAIQTVERVYPRAQDLGEIKKTLQRDTLPDEGQ